MSEQRPRYEILRVVNRGGMGEIALARARGVKGFEKLVVLKRLRPDAEREDHIQMFDVEQEVMSRIEHPNIVKVFDQPYLDGIPYMAMEYIRGRNLDQIVRASLQSGNDLPLNLTLTVISEVLRGLAFVHRLKDSEGRPLGVVHQDMTPSNVLVSFFGEVKVTDFGISYVTSRDGGLRKGVLKGKPRYVAPEVLAGKRVNNRADIYGVGVVLYEMLTGRALFARSTVKETLAAVARNELPDFSTELARFGNVPMILERSLRKDPAERYRTAEAMAADVLNELSKRGGPVPPATVGILVRNLFRNDPDVPEVDPDLEQAISLGSTGAVLPAPRNLDETLQELDRLLGPSGSVDLFTLPADLAMELDDLEDMEPFTGETPLPEIMWRAKSDQEILEHYTRPEGLIGEPAPLFDDEASPGAPPPPPQFEEEASPPAPPPHRAVTGASESPTRPGAPPAAGSRGGSTGSDALTAPMAVGTSWTAAPPGSAPRPRPEPARDDRRPGERRRVPLPDEGGKDSTAAPAGGAGSLGSGAVDRPLPAGWSGPPDPASPALGAEVSVGPVGPVAPKGSDRPVGPVAPAGVAPLGPDRPVGPVAPVGPGAAVGSNAPSGSGSAEPPPLGAVATDEPAPDRPHGPVAAFAEVGTRDERGLLSGSDAVFTAVPPPARDRGAFVRGLILGLAVGAGSTAVAFFWLGG